MNSKLRLRNSQLVYCSILYPKEVKIKVYLFKIRMNLPSCKTSSQWYVYPSLVEKYSLRAFKNLSILILSRL